MPADLRHRSGNLFDAPYGAVLVHACNTRGVWGAGVAAEFSRRFPHAQCGYRNLCADAQCDMLLGSARVLQDGEHAIACLFTSRGYARHVDPPDAILAATRRALISLLEQFPSATEFHSPRINAGCFRVPWERTETVLRDVLAAWPVEHHWTVWTP